MTTQTKSRGFTIVELLIVIVIIAILAAITIVAYNGITNRANTSSAKAAANSAAKKAEAYSADDQGGNGSYPSAAGTLTSASTSSTYYLSGVSFTTAATKPTTPSQVQYSACGSGAGYKVFYWDYTAATPAWTQIASGGTTTGTCTLTLI